MGCYPPDACDGLKSYKGIDDENAASGDTDVQNNN